MRFTAALVGLGLLAGCSTADSYHPNYNKIRTASTEQVSDCRYLGPISTFGAPILGGMTYAMKMARNTTAERGGSHMVIVNTSTSESGGYTSGRVEAEAYACPFG